MKLKVIDDDRRVSVHRKVLDGPVFGAGRMKIPFKPTPKNPLILSASEIGSFLRCRLSWNWSYRLGLRKTGVKQEQGIGILVHEMLEKWYRLRPEKRNVKRMAKIALKHLVETPLSDVDDKSRKLALAMVVGYAEWVRGNHDSSDAAIGLRSARAYPEEWFTMRLTEDGSVLVRGRLDLRWQPTNLRKTMAIGEAKTRGGISFNMLDLNHQLMTYLIALRARHPGMKRYIAYRTVLRRQLPGPRVKAPLFGRESVELRGDDIGKIDVWLKDTRRLAKDVLDAAIYPNQRDSCSWDCDFYKLCVLRSEGNRDDFKDVVGSEYEQR